MEARVRIPFYSSGRCGLGCQAQNSYCKFKLKLRLEHARYFSFFFSFNESSVYSNNLSLSSIVLNRSTEYNQLKMRRRVLSKEMS